MLGPGGVIGIQIQLFPGEGVHSRSKCDFFSVYVQLCMKEIIINHVVNYNYFSFVNIFIFH